MSHFSRYQLSTSKDGDVLHVLPGHYDGCFYGNYLQSILKLVDDHGCQGFGLEVLGDYHERLMRLLGEFHEAKDLARTFDNFVDDYDVNTMLIG